MRFGKPLGTSDALRPSPNMITITIEVRDEDGELLGRSQTSSFDRAEEEFGAIRRGFEKSDSHESIDF